MQFKWHITKTEWFLIPCIGIINERYYYGYKVFSVAFAWLCWRSKIEIGVKKYRG